jgi:hypothetical protein
MDADEFVRRLQDLWQSTRKLSLYEPFLAGSIASWGSIRARDGDSLWDDPIAALMARYECGQVALANFRFRAELVPGYGGLYEFMTGGGAAFCVQRGTHDLYTFYYLTDVVPHAFLQSSDVFLSTLLIYAEYLTRLTRELPRVRRQSLAEIYWHRTDRNPLWRREFFFFER